MMRGARSGSRARQDLLTKPIQSPSRRRVTRSQSRDIEEDRPNSNDISSRKRHDSRNTRELTKALPAVVEESHLKTPRKPVAIHGRSSSVPETPEEDVTNMEGTTILPSEPESGLDAEMMLEALPDIQRTGKGVLDFLAPTTASPVQIVNKAKLLSDPKNTQSRRLQRLRSNFDRDTRLFGSDTYIDAASIDRIFLPVVAGKREELTGWSPSPIIQSANCARFAIEVLLAGDNLNSQRQAVRSVERLFPLPFLTDLVDDEQDRGPGESALQKETFDLALEIRKQSLISLLDDKQGDPEFNPKNAVKLCFFTGLSRQSPPRGFNLPSLGGLDGALPARYRDSIQSVYDDILLSEEDGTFNVDELRNSYLWKRFVLQAAQWLRKRTEEIHNELKTRKSAQEVHEAYFASKNSSFASTLGGSEAEPSGDMEEVEPEIIQQDIQQEVVAPSEPQQQQPEPAATPSDVARRRSFKPSFLNTSSMQRILQRKERLRSESVATDNRRRSDIAPVSRAANEQRDADRRQTISALPSSQPTQQAAAREIPLSFEDASPTLLPDEPNLTIGDDSQLAIGDDSTQIERSHSPPTTRRSTAPWRQEPPSIEQRADRETTIQRGSASQQMLSSQVLWEMTKNRAPAQSAGTPTRNGTARFIDRQRHAARISPISINSSQDAVGRVEERVSRKRARSSPETESDADSGLFDYDRRPVDLDSRRAEKPAQSQSRSKRRRLDEPETRLSPNIDIHENGDSVQPEPLRRAPRRRDRALIDPTLSPKQYTATAKRSWTTAEDNRLIRLMREHGPHWAVLERQNLAQAERQDEEKISRDQVALKDRARNMKIALYRDGLPIPQYLRSVGLKAADREKLRTRGIVLRPEDDK